MSSSNSTARNADKKYTEADIVRIIPCNRNKEVWDHFDLCLMNDNLEKARCKLCGDFYGKEGNSSLRKHKYERYPVLKAQAEGNQPNITPTGGIFVYNNDELREEFTKFVIQEGLSFNHFDNPHLKKIIRTKMQPQYKQVIDSLLVGGRLTLVKSMLGSLSTYYLSIFKAPLEVLKNLESLRNRFFIGGSDLVKRMTWVAWDKVLRPKEKGGLGVGSLFALNRALLYKWKWKVLTQSSNLWVMVIKALYGEDGGLNGMDFRGVKNSCWFNILKSIRHLNEKGVELDKFLNKKIGNGMLTSFWNDIWLGDICLRDKFPRMFALSVNRDISVAAQLHGITLNFRRPARGGEEAAQWASLIESIRDVSLGQDQDTWHWALNGASVFNVATTRCYIDEIYLGDGCPNFTWNNLLPIKVNVFAWKVSIKRLPTKDNLLNRGIPIQTTDCSNCSNSSETINHLFFSCSMALDLWSMCGRWCGIHIPLLLSWNDWRLWMESIRLEKKRKKRLEAITLALMWSIWLFRNALCFASVKPRKGDLFHKFVVQAYLWVSSRDRSGSYVWSDWLCSPLL